MPPLAPQDQEPTLAARQGAALRELVEIGLALARKLPELAEREDADPEALALAFGRISRAVRLTLSLEDRLQRAAARTAPAPPQPWELRGLTQNAWRRADERAEEAFELAEKAIEREAEGLERDRLLEDLCERFDEERDEAAFLSEAPVAQVVAAICRDLGVAPDWAVFKADDFDAVDERTLRTLRLGRGLAPAGEAENADEATPLAGPSAARPRGKPPPNLN